MTSLGDGDDWLLWNKSMASRERRTTNWNEEKTNLIDQTKRRNRIKSFQSENFIDFFCFYDFVFDEVTRGSQTRVSLVNRTTRFWIRRPNVYDDSRWWKHANSIRRDRCVPSSFFCLFRSSSSSLIFSEIPHSARCLQLTRKIYVDAPSLAKSVAEPQQRRHPSERAVGASANELHTYTSTVICLTLSPAGHVNDAPTERKENKFHFFFGKEKVGAVFFDVSGPRSGTWVIPVINNSCGTKEGYAKDCGRGQ